MEYTKTEYENKINSSPLFDICDDKDSEAFKAQSYKLLKLLAEYYSKYIFPNRPLESYSAPLMETAVACFKSYDKTRGSFLNYFNPPFERNRTIAIAKEREQDRRKGLVAPQRKDKLIRQIISFASSKNLDINDISVQEQIAKYMGISIRNVSELLQQNYETAAISSTVTDEEGEEADLFDFISAGGQTVEENIVAEDAVNEIIKSLEKAYLSLQDRPVTKKVISMTLTCRILKGLKEDVEHTKRLLKNTAFYDGQVIQIYIEEGRLIKQKDIAQMCGVLPPSAKRTFENFLAKLPNKKR